MENIDISNKSTLNDNNNDTTNTDDDIFKTQVIHDLQYYLSKRNGDHHDNNNNNNNVNESSSSSSSKLLLDPTAMAIPVIAMKVLYNVVQRSTSETMMGLQYELQYASNIIITNYNNNNNYNNNTNNNNNTTTTTTTSTSTTKESTTDGTTSHNCITTTTTIPSSYSISLQSGIELFLHYITRSYLEKTNNFNDCRLQVLQRGQQFQYISQTARNRIANIVIEHYTNLIPNHNNYNNNNNYNETTTTTTTTTTILTIGFSRVVATILNTISQTKHFNLIIVEEEEGGDGGGGSRGRTKTSQCYNNEMKHIPIMVVPYSAIGYILEEQHVTMILVGSYVIVENGGCINRCGTYTLAMCAHMLHIPFYVAAESYKFARLYPLHQSDIPCYNNNININNNSNHDTTTTTTTTNISSSSPPPSSKQHQQQYQNHNYTICHPNVDYTPAKYITLFFTDLGILTTSAVSDELIRLYQ